MLPIEVVELKKYYGNAKGVDNVSFNVHEKEIFGFIGPNGAGKSTTIRALLGLLKPTGGNVYINGVDCTKKGDIARRDVGYMSSEVSLYPNMTCIEVLHFVCDMRKVGYERIDPLATRFELPLQKKCKELSLGNKKKLMIISALVSSPSVIILDEPTTGLDPLMKSKFFELLKEEQARGATIMMSSHVLSDVQKICDRVAIVKNGNIVSVEKISAFKDKYLKKIKFTTKYSQPQITLEGVANEVTEGNMVSFQFRGDMTSLIKYLSSIDVEDVTIEDSDLEAVFMHYYQ